MLTYADVCGMPRTGEGVTRDVNNEKGSEFDFKYSFNVSSRVTGMYITYICIYIYNNKIYIIKISMFRPASQVRSLLALLVLYWYKGTNILTLRAASQGSTFWKFSLTAFMCRCRRFCLMSRVPYAPMRICLLILWMASAYTLPATALCQHGATLLTLAVSCRSRGLNSSRSKLCSMLSHCVTLFCISMAYEWFH